MSKRLILALSVLLLGILGMGVYSFHLMNRAEDRGSQADSQPITPPVSVAPAQITLVLANDSDGSLSGTQTSIMLPQDTTKRAREILRALVAKYVQPGSPHPLGAGADIKDVYLAGSDLVVVDTNAAFAEGHPSGILVEELTLASMMQTLAANLPGVTRMKVLVEGEERPLLAGHADLSEPYNISFDYGRLHLQK
jgi:hypothetical protein